MSRLAKSEARIDFETWSQHDQARSIFKCYMENGSPREQIEAMWHAMGLNVDGNLWSDVTGGRDISVNKNGNKEMLSDH